MHRLPDLPLTLAAASQIRHGHPWIWSRGVASPRALASLAPGDAVRLVDPERQPLGMAVVDPGAPIVARVWSEGDAVLDGAHVVAKLARAVERRRGLVSERTTAYRMLHGEGDRTPGLVIDRYGDASIVKLDGEAARVVAERFRGEIVGALAGVGVDKVAVRTTTPRGVSLIPWTPTPPPDTTTVLEHGVPFVVDLARGQKTGAFLDQRENRRRVGQMSRGRRVLNLFSYAGGFSLHAALGGATRVTSVDVAAQAHATAQASFRAAEVDPRAHAFVTADVFAFLAEARDRGEAWDLIVSDPPSFAPSEKSRARALTAYRTLHRAAAAVLAPGGVLCAASCSSHVDAEAFLGTLDDAARSPRPLSLVEGYGQPLDHPTLPGWPEGRYLKFMVLM